MDGGRLRVVSEVEVLHAINLAVKSRGHNQRGKNGPAETRGLGQIWKALAIIGAF